MLSDDREETIRQRLTADDPEALTMIYDTYARGLHGFLLAQQGRAGDAEEILQRVFLKIARAPRRLLAARRLADFLFIMTRNEGLSYLRNEGRRNRLKSDGDWEHLLEPASPGQEPRVPREAIESALRELPPEQREVVVLKCWQDMTFREIADLLDVGMNTVASRYRYALDKLRGRLGKEDRP